MLNFLHHMEGFAMADEAWTSRTSFDIVFPDGGTALAICLNDPDDCALALDVLGLRRPSCPTLILVGGAGDMGDSQMKYLRPLFVDMLASLAGELGAAVVDGGTDAGVMRLMGHARAETGGTFPLIGVVASGTVILPGADSQAHKKVALEPHHTHFLLVPGCNWGDESPWMAYIASVLSGEAPSVTVLVDGGEIALEDVERSVEHQRPVVVVASTGRAAGRLTAALRGEPSDERAQALAASGLLRVVDRAEGSHSLANVIREALSIGG
jgi:hypothetical protein